MARFRHPPSPPRPAAPFGCPHWPGCVGCPWVGRPYEDQLASKHHRVVAALAAALPDAVVAAVDPVVPTSEPSGYRVQAKLVVGSVPAGVVLGLYAPGTHRIVDASGCPLHDPLLRRAIPALRAALERERVPIHGQGRTGLRYALLRASVAEERLLVTLVSSRAPLSQATRVARRLRRTVPLAGLLVNENRTSGNVILGARTEAVFGERALRERYGEVVIAAGPTAFVQANTRMAARIYGAIAEAAAVAADTRVVDLYCGVGGIALTLARTAGTVVGVEEVAAAVAAARANAARAGATHVRFVAGRVEEALGGLTEPVDVVTMNPPRKGAGAAVARAVAALAPRRILYLSCHPESFARDAAVLADGGFTLARVRPFDLLPQTEHVEVLGIFVRDSA
ncbi:MAG: 23S rRNA (uracil(1939)-C(5))-methyltransferase RlmD [Deltaproteobacteria bacterium]|nr:23S rRNA (uracil(1939)-C(5))-methyltransferase RlmD [Deltaproteobacteria bacterium]